MKKLTDPASRTARSDARFRFGEEDHRGERDFRSGGHRGGDASVGVYCTVANKPTGAGVIDFSKVKETRTGNFVAPGAFVEDFGREILIRGGAGDKGTGNGSQFGAATENANNNGPPDHGVVEAE